MFAPDGFGDAGDDRQSAPGGGAVGIEFLQLLPGGMDVEGRDIFPLPAAIHCGDHDFLLLNFQPDRNHGLAAFGVDEAVQHHIVQKLAEQKFDSGAQFLIPGMVLHEIAEFQHARADAVRRRLELPGERKLLHTVRGMGWVLKEDA